MEEALRAAGPAPDLARERRGAVPDLGPQVARERRRRRRAARDHRLRQRLSQVRHRGLQVVPARSTRVEGTGVVVAPPRTSCSGRRRSRSRTRPSWARSGPPRNGSGSSGRCSRSSPRSTSDAKRLGLRPSSSRSTCSRSATTWPRTSVSIAKGETLEEAPAITNPPRPRPPPTAAPADASRAARRRRRRWARWASRTPRRSTTSSSDSTQFKILPFRSPS